jgi:hypothetical protein
MRRPPAPAIWREGAFEASVAGDHFTYCAGFASNFALQLVEQK